MRMPRVIRGTGAEVGPIEEVEVEDREDVADDLVVEALDAFVLISVAMTVETDADVQSNSKELPPITQAH